MDELCPTCTWPGSDHDEEGLDICRRWAAFAGNPLPYHWQNCSVHGRTWVLMCEYHRRIADEAFRFNTVSPPPSSEVWAETTALGKHLGRIRSFLAVALIPDRLARRYAS